MQAGSNIYLALMGDPTLRLKVTAPAADPAAAISGTNVVLTWSLSLDSGAQYFVYRSTNGISSTFTRLTTNPINTATFTDTNAPTGSKIYQVRSLISVTSGSGSYTNLSQGVFVNVN